MSSSRDPLYQSSHTQLQLRIQPRLEESRQKRDVVAGDKNQQPNVDLSRTYLLICRACQPTGTSRCPATGSGRPTGDKRKAFSSQLRSSLRVLPTPPAARICTATTNLQEARILPVRREEAKAIGEEVHLARYLGRHCICTTNSRQRYELSRTRRW